MAVASTTRISDGWVASPRTDELERTYWRSDLDDSGWDRAAIPSQWATEPDFDPDGNPVAYRVRFAMPELEAGLRARVRANGVFYYAHYWLDDFYLGDRSGYFLAQECECTQQLATGGEHLLAMEVTCPEDDPTAKTIVTGVFSHWDAIGGDFNPGGIWRPVEIVVTGPAFLTHTMVIPVEVSPAHARLNVHIGADSAVDAEATLVARLVHVDTGAEVTGFERRWHLNQGANAAIVPLDVADPELWWPRHLGEQPLYKLALDLVGSDKTVWDSARRTTGIRSIQVDNWVFRVNGERLFVRGSNYAPTHAALSEIQDADIERDLSLAAEANLDLLRVHAHVAPAHMYEAADRAGILLWQDFPLQWGYSRRMKRPGLEQAVGMVRELGSHPSIAMWCCHNEPLAVADTENAALELWPKLKVAASMMLPTWNKNVLDPALRRAMTQADPSRFVNEKSGELPGVLSYGTDSHLYFGWYFGEMRQFASIARAAPRLFRFISEFGAQALPSVSAVEEMLPGASKAWPELDWELLRDEHCLQPELLHRFVPPVSAASLAEYVELTQDRQGELLRYYVETIRRHKYRPSGGFCQFQFNDSGPSITWSVLDHRREPKSGFAALASACADVIIVAEYPTSHYEPGEDIALGLYVISELRRPLRDLVLEAGFEGRTQRWEGNVDADSVSGVGIFEATLPTTPGSYELSLRLSEGNIERCVNRYELRVRG